MRGRNGQARWLLTACCLVGAAVLMAAALTGKPEEGDGKWVPMNEAVKEILAESGESSSVSLEGKPETEDVHGETAAGGGGGESDSSSGGDEGSGGGNQVDGGGSGGSLNADQQDGGERASVSNEAGNGAEIQDSPSDTVSAGAEKIDINLASAEQLDGLKGIGPAKAKAIVEDRERNGKFRSVDDLLRVKGIGEKLLSSIKESVVALP